MTEKLDLDHLRQWIGRSTEASDVVTAQLVKGLRATLFQEIGEPKAVRAVARACAGNPVAVAVPCHRVVRSDGELAGYRWGIARKRKLLEQEQKQR